MSYAPTESEEWIQFERFFLAGYLVVGVGYGIQLILYLSCAMYLWKKRKQNRASLFLLFYMTLLLSIETILVIARGNTVQIMYIDKRNYPGGPWQFFLNMQNIPVNVIFYATLFVLTFLSDLLVLWRCWVIWTPSGEYIAYLVTAFPATALLASFVMGTLWTLQSSYPGWSMYSTLPVAYGTSYYSISLGVNVILTSLIMTRLLLYRRRMLSTLPPEHAKHYLSLVAIVAESAALYSVCSILFLITYAINQPINQVLLVAASAGQQISGYLIIYRLAEGRAWKKDTLATLPTIHFHNKQTTHSATLTNLSPFQATCMSSEQESLPLGRSSVGDREKQRIYKKRPTHLK